MMIFELAVLRGVIDGDPGLYFGSTLALEHWVQRAKEEGLIADAHAGGYEPTPRGVDLYERILCHLPKCRQVFWRGDALAQLIERRS